MSGARKSGDMNGVIWVDEMDTSSSDWAGPKMAKLGELGRLGLAVPDGFALTTDAYHEVLGSRPVRREIDRLLASAVADDSASVTRAARLVRHYVLGLGVPAGIEHGIVEAYNELCLRRDQPNLATAVRSSATGEDAADASFAGQFDSYLGVTGPESVVEAVRSCWASLFTDRGVAYRMERGISHVDCPMAVGVLELIDAKASGIAFSIHPVTGRSDRIVMEGSWGWGEAIVQGLVVPDRAEVGKSDRRILDYVVSAKLVMSAFDQTAGAVVETGVPESLRQARVLRDDEVLAIADSVISIESHFGHPVDVEWVASASQDGQPEVTIVQARPETVHAGEEKPEPAWDPSSYALKYAFGTKPKK